VAPDPVLRKSQCYRLWQSGAFGNKLRAWRTVEEWRASGHREPVTLRCLLGPGGRGPCSYDVRPDEVDGILGTWTRLGISREDVMLNEGAPDDAVLVQGEYLNDVVTLGDGELACGIFYHSLVRRKMRDALAAGARTATGLAATEILRRHMSSASYEDWQDLIGRYPGHVLEVSVYDRYLGDLPRRNALVWEVRRY